MSRTANREAVKVDLVPFLLQWGAVPLTQEEGSRPQEAAGSWQSQCPGRLVGSGLGLSWSGDC